MQCNANALYCLAYLGCHLVSTAYVAYAPPESRLLRVVECSLGEVPQKRPILVMDDSAPWRVVTATGISLISLAVA